MSDKGYTLADLQRMREEMEISARLARAAREHRMRQLLGDDVYDFVTAGPTRQVPSRPADDPVARARARIIELGELAESLTAETGETA